MLPDELVYSDLARSIAAGGRPAVRGVPVFGWGEVYPSVIAPVWALIGDRYAAYHVTLVVGAVVMSLAAVPAYFIGRMFVSRRSSLLVAALAVIVPSLSYTGAVLTENACYPVFLVAVLFLARAVRTPTLGAQTAALVALGVLAFTRIQGVAMLGAYASAVVVYSLTGGQDERRAYLRRFAPTAAATVMLALGPVVGSLARGDGALGWLGQRSGTFDELHARWRFPSGSHSSRSVSSCTSGVPAVATVIMSGAGLSRAADERLRLFAAVSRPTLVAMLLSVALVSASFDVDQVGNLNERYVFYIVPLTFIGVALWIERGLPRPRPCPASCSVSRVWRQSSYRSSGSTTTPGSKRSRRPMGRNRPVGWRNRPARRCGDAVLRDRVGYELRRTTWRMWTVVAVWMSLLGLFAVESNRCIGVEDRGCVRWSGGDVGLDDALPPGAEVGVLWDETLARKNLPDSFYFWLMVTEFFNDAIGDVYRLGPPTFYENVPADGCRACGIGRTVVRRDDRPVTVEYALVTCRTPSGDVIAVPR